MPTVGLLINETKPPALEAARQLAVALHEQGVRVVSLATLAARMGDSWCTPATDAADLAEEADFVVVFGGDGTLLSAARLLAPYDRPILGAHLGHFGFLTQVAPENLREAVDAIIAGRYKIEERAMLGVSITRHSPTGEPVPTSPPCEFLLGMNDVVVASGAVRMVYVETRIGDRLLATYAADGVIISTPTGSTGYSLSAGGPLVHPSAPVFVINPICPHTLNARPLIIPDTESVNLSIEPTRPDTAGVMSVDGQIEVPLAPGDIVTVSRAPYRIKLLNVGGPDFYDKIRDRWRYGERVSA